MARSSALQQRPNTFAQTNLSLSFFACDKAADHTFRVACRSGAVFARVAARVLLPILIYDLSGQILL